MVLTASALNRARQTVVVVPLSTRSLPRLPTVVRRVDSVAVCDRMRAVDKSRLTRFTGRLTATDVRVVENRVQAILNL